MSFLHAIILGIVEGITEFLPISSTGHMIVVSSLLGIPETAFRSSFEIAIQLGAILAVVAIYARKVLQHPKLLVPVGVAFVPTAIVGFVLYSVIKDVLLGNVWIVLAAMIGGGVVILLLEKKFGKTLPKDNGFRSITREVNEDHGVSRITPQKAVLIGLCQSLAVIPGVSRSAATVMGGMSLGLSREEIVEFSFLLAVPTMLAATGYDLLKTGVSFSDREWLVILVGALTAFVVAFAVVRWFLRYISRGTFVSFAWYRILAGSVVAIFVLFS
jgi:undecaprenyl-diphosphatase